MKAFIGRKEESRKLREFLEDPDCMSGLVYGRRRIGKSRLLKEVTSSCANRIYFECTQSSEASNANNLYQYAADILHLPPATMSRAEDVLRYIFQQTKDVPALLILDEYPYLREKTEGLDSILQVLIDEYKGKSQLKIILCGSFVEIMKSLIGKQNPLHGRIDFVLQIKAMNYLESSLFYPGFSLEDKVSLYSVFGGIPYYNSLVRSDQSVEENILRLIASENSRLELEIITNLWGELNKISNANDVLETIAKNTTRFSDILSRSHISGPSSLNHLLEKLQQMELIEKKAPINDLRNPKKTGYHVCDPLTRFYYRYIFSNRSKMMIMDPHVFFQKVISEDFHSQYVPKAFEEICREFLILLNRKGQIEPVLETIGKYWYDDPVHKKNGEFDIVAKDELGWVFCECKFRTQKISHSDIEKEIAQVKDTGLNCWKYLFFSKSGFETSLQPRANLKFYSLEDLYADSLLS